MHRPHRHFHGKGGKERQPQPGLHFAGKLVGEKDRNIGGTGVPVHRHHGEQHQQRAQQRVEEEFEAGIHAPLAAPDADDQEHRDQAALEEQIKQDEIEGAEHAEHQRLEQQKGDHVLLDAVFDRFPARQNAKRHQEGGQNNEQQRNAVDTHLVANGGAEPLHLLHELEARVGVVEVRPQIQRCAEGEERRVQRDPAGIALGHRILRGDQKRPGQREKGNQGEDIEAGCVHRPTPP